MGLDMYFYAAKQDYKSECSWNNEVVPPVNYPESLKKIEEYLTKIQEFKSCTVETLYKIGYFRKFNALHQYIVDHFADGVDDCREIQLSKEDIEQTLMALYRAKNGQTEYLPTQSGFFFGSTEYDKWYFNDVDNAITLFELILKAAEALIRNLIDNLKDCTLLEYSANTEYTIEYIEDAELITDLKEFLK